MLTVAQAAESVGRTPGTVRRWIHSGRLPATVHNGRFQIAPSDLDPIRNTLYPMADLPEEWQHFEDGTPVLNWVAAVTIDRSGC